MIATAILSLMPLAATAQIGLTDPGSLAQNYMSARELATILAAEGPCGFAYDPAALEAFIDSRVGAENTGFLATLSVPLGAAKLRMEQMSGSEKVVYCRQAGRNAQAFGFLAE